MEGDLRVVGGEVRERTEEPMIAKKNAVHRDEIVGELDPSVGAHARRTMHGTARGTAKARKIESQQS
jgi:hypothetical protein